MQLKLKANEISAFVKSKHHENKQEKEKEQDRSIMHLIEQPT